jgi:hypothetical protein
MILVIFVLLIALLAFCSYEYGFAHRKISQSTLTQNAGSKPDGSIPLTKNSSSSAGALEFPELLPRAEAGSVQDNEYYVDSSHAIHVIFKYSEANPTGTTAQASYLKNMQATGWQNIKADGSTITATRGGYVFSVTFSAINSNTTLVSITYTLTPSKVTNEK